MSKANVFRWIKERAESLPAQDTKAEENIEEPVSVIELDEMFWYLKKRK